MSTSREWERASRWREPRQLASHRNKALLTVGHRLCLRGRRQTNVIMSPGPHPAPHGPGSGVHTAVPCACADSRGFLTLPLRFVIALTKAHPNDLKHLTGSHKSKGTPGYSHNSVPPPSPIEPSRGSGLGAVGGLTYLIHAAKWGNNVTNYEQAQSPACGILPFVSLHHVSAELLGRGRDTGVGTSQQQEASPALERFTHLGRLTLLGLHGGAPSLFAKKKSLFTSRINIKKQHIIL